MKKNSLLLFIVWGSCNCFVYYSTDFAEIVYSKILILYTFDFLTQALFEETVWQMVVVRRMLLHKY